MVEFAGLANVQSRVEHPRTQLLQTTRIQRLPHDHVATRSNFHHVLDQLIGPRARHGLHHAQVPRVRIHCHDAADANRAGAADAVYEE